MIPILYKRNRSLQEQFMRDHTALTAEPELNLHPDIWLQTEVSFQHSVAAALMLPGF